MTLKSQRYFFLLLPISVLVLVLLTILTSHRKQPQNTGTGARGSRRDRNASEWVNHTEEGFKISNADHLCKGKKTLLLILIHSKPGNFEKRISIRETWGSLNGICGDRIRHVFLLGLVKNSTTQAAIVEESQSQSDIVQGNFIDSYKNLTLKDMFGLQWTKTFCSQVKFVAKTDDDVFINIFKVWSLLTTSKSVLHNPRFFYGRVFRNDYPVRPRNESGVSHKWMISKEEYKNNTYPPHCKGFFYLFPGNMAADLLNASGAYKILFPLEDIFTTGFLSRDLKIPLIAFTTEFGFAREYRYSKFSEAESLIRKAMVLYRETDDDPLSTHYLFWKLSLKEHPSCITQRSSTSSTKDALYTQSLKRITKTGNRIPVTSPPSKEASKRPNVTKMAATKVSGEIKG